jgi:type VI secretion system protein ImpA
MIAAEELLQPISEEAPCGEDLSYDASLQALENMARGKPETQFSGAEPPDWKELNSRCLELFARSKDLRIAMILCVAALELDGPRSFRESLALVKGLLEKYWAAVHPQLDPSDNSDPLQRMNIIASLATPIGTFGDHFRILERLRAAPLCNSVQMGRYSAADILRVETGIPAEGDKTAPTLAQIDAAFRDSNLEKLGELYHTLNDCIALVAGIDELLTRTVGATRAPDLTPLAAELLSMQKRIEPYLPASSVSAANQASVPESGPSLPAASKALSLTGEIRSREDVVRLLHKMCEYYAQAEPSSPVPLVLKRAARLAEMDFMQIIKDMSPETIAQIQTITGEQNPDGPPAGNR